MSTASSGKVFRRETIIAMLQAALQSSDYRFARQVALSWLAAFPGDLEVTLLQGRAMIAEGRSAQVIAALDLVCRKDPFSSAAYQVMARAAQGLDPHRYTVALSSLYVLDGLLPENARLEAWAAPLRQALVAFERSDLAEAEKCVQEALYLHPDLLLAAALQLLIVRAQATTPELNALVETYHNRWPDCLLINLLLVESYLTRGNEQDAVRLLHLCAANDASGQVACRLWGTNHPYRSLWPDDLVILLDQPIPAGVAARLGWNHLPAGELRAKSFLDLAPVESGEPDFGTLSPEPTWVDDALVSNTEQAVQASPTLTAADMAMEAEIAGIIAQVEAEMADDGSKGVDPAAAKQPTRDGIALEESALAVEAEAEPTPETPAVNAAGSDAEKPVKRSQARPAGQRAGRPAHDRSRVRSDAEIDENLKRVKGEFARLAADLKQPDLSASDGRQPVYVIFSSKEGLSAQYGPQTARVLDVELRKLACLVRRRGGWDALVYYPDDADSTAALGLTPVNPQDPWKLKNALADLDQALGKRGERIGALLITGGDKVVPFHRLPNPTDDADRQIISDSPYATLDANYFVPEWPVGRLPGEAGPDVGLLMEQIRQIQREHAKRKSTPVLFGWNLSTMLGNWIARLLPSKNRSSFGYTAAVWRRSSLAVFRPIGAPHTVMASPPEHSGSVDRERIMASHLGYYNLHGLEDGPAWYGQRDPLEGATAPDYPVAITPGDLHRNGKAPRIVFSEACYGGHIFEKCVDDSLALKFLSTGTLAVIGSTGVSYGSINTPLIAADLLGNFFWQHIKSGRTVGEAFVQAKVDLVREMNRRQGFLDGEDQKTLISFVLYGDPLAVFDGFRVRSKVALRPKEHLSVKVVSDRNSSENIAPQISGEALRQVKKIVAEYLPGADMADFHLIQQAVPDGEAPTRKKSGAASRGRVVVTVSKTFHVAQQAHHHYMRLTLDEAGKPIKMSISR